MSSEKPKKKWYQKWWVWVIVVVFAIAALPRSEEAETPEQDDTAAPTVEQDANTPEDSGEIADDVENTQPEETLIFDLVAGEAGEYGEMFAMNKDTEFEENYYIYRIPAGTYTVTNSGEYMAQLSVYGNEIVVSDAGWEEPATVHYVKVLDVGASDTVTIPEDCFIEIHDPARFTFELNK